MRINEDNVKVLLKDIKENIDDAFNLSNNHDCDINIVCAISKIESLLTLIDFEDEDKNMKRPQPKTGVIEYR